MPKGLMMSPQRELRFALIAALLVMPFAASAKHGSKDDPRLTPLMNAARQNDLARVRTLLTDGADVKAKTAEGETALYEAIERLDLNADNLPVVDALLVAGADPNEKETYGLTALAVSLTRNYANPAVTMRLLQAGASVPRECGDGDSLVSLATQESSLEVMRALIHKGAPVNCRYRGASALFWAALNGQADRVQLLLESGADPTIRVDGKTMLEAATCTNPDRRVQTEFEQTRHIIQAALASTSTSKSHSPE